jgi:hypothetical protein
MTSGGDDEDSQFDELLNQNSKYSQPRVGTLNSFNTTSSRKPNDVYAASNSTNVSARASSSIAAPRYQAMDVKSQTDTNLKRYEDTLSRTLVLNGPVDASAQIEENLNEINRYKQAHDYSNDLSDVYENFYVPLYCNRLTFSSQYFESVVNDLTAVRFASDAFLSRTDYAQGDDSMPIIDPSELGQGDRTNTFLITADLLNITTNCDFPIAVVLGEVNRNDFVPYEKRDVYVQSASAKSVRAKLANRVHAIIPPRGTSKLRIFTSGYEINSSYGAEYPWLTGDAKVLRDQLHQMPLKTDRLVTLESPIAKWLFKHCAEYDWEPPQLTEVTGNPYFQIPAEQAETAIDAIVNVIKTEVPIKNLEQIAVQFIQLREGVYKDEASTKKVPYVSFVLSTRHVFRNRYSPKEIEQVR